MISPMNAVDTTRNTTWTRPKDGRWMAGVAAGVSREIGISADAVRVIFVVAGLAGGLGIVLYLAGWLIMPGEGEDRALGKDLIDHFDAQDVYRIVAVALIVIGAVILAGLLTAHLGPWIIGFGLVAIGLLLLRK